MVVLFLIFTFGGSTFRNSWASPLAAATRTIRELFLFKSSYIQSLYGIFYSVINLTFRITSKQTLMSYITLARTCNNVINLFQKVEKIFYVISSNFKQTSDMDLLHLMQDFQVSRAYMLKKALVCIVKSNQQSFKKTFLIKQ